MLEQKTLLIIAAVAVVAGLGYYFLMHKKEGSGAPMETEPFKAVMKTYPDVGQPRVTAIRNPGYLDNLDYASIYQ